MIDNSLLSLLREYNRASDDIAVLRARADLGPDHPLEDSLGAADNLAQGVREFLHLLGQGAES